MLFLKNSILSNNAKKLKAHYFLQNCCTKKHIAVLQTFEACNFFNIGLKTLFFQEIIQSFLKTLKEKVLLIPVLYLYSVNYIVEGSSKCSG